MISFIKHITIPVADQDRALKFYTESLGFTLITDAPMDEEDGGQRWIELEIPGAQTQLVLFTPEGQEELVGTPQNAIFATDDLDKSFTEMKARGVEFETEPTHEEWGSFAVFKDSEGNTFVLGSED